MNRLHVKCQDLFSKKKKKRKKLRKYIKKLSSAAVVIGALTVKECQYVVFYLAVTQPYSEKAVSCEGARLHEC